MGESSTPDFASTFQTENNIHVLACALNSFFAKVYKQPPNTWCKEITDVLLFSFLMRPVLSHACFFGERSDIGRSVLLSPSDEIRQNWLDWFAPLLTFQSDFVAPDEVETAPNALSSGEHGPEIVWATNMLLVCTCLHWSFLNRPPEDFGAALQEVQTRCEGMPGGWNEVAASRIRGIYKGVLKKVLKATTKQDQDMRILDNIVVLAGVIEDFTFYCPFSKQGVNVESHVIGVHLDANGLVCRELLKLMNDMIQNQLRDSSGGTIVKMIDKKEKNEAKKRKEALEEVGALFAGFLAWSNSLTSTVEIYVQLKTMPGSKLEMKQEFSCFGPADGSHVRVNDRVMVHTKEKRWAGTLQYKGAVGARVILGIAFEDCAEMSEDIECAKYFKCQPGYGGLTKPEQVQLVNELIVNANYEKATSQLVDQLAKRARFKNVNKKQALNTLQEAAYLGARLRHTTRPEGPLPNAEFNTSWADIPYEVVLEQAKAGAYSLRRAVRFLDKTLTAKSSFAASLIKICQEEDTKTLADEMGVIAHDIQTSSEYCLAVRMRNFVAAITLEVKTPFEALEKDHDAAVNELKAIYGKAEKEIETAREKLIAQMKDAWKLYEQVIQLRGEMQEGMSSPKAANAAAKLPPITQKCGFLFAQYERACTEWVQKGQPAFRAFQQQALAAFQLKEQRRLIATRAYLERYLAICEKFNEPYYQIKNHFELIGRMAPLDDLATFAIQNRKIRSEAPLPQLPCSGAEVLTGTNERELMASNSPPVDARSPPPKNKYATVGASPSLARPPSLGPQMQPAGIGSPIARRGPPPRQPPRVSGMSNDDPRASEVFDEPIPEPSPAAAAEPAQQQEDEVVEEQRPQPPSVPPAARPPTKYATVESGRPVPLRLQLPQLPMQLPLNPLRPVASSGSLTSPVQQQQQEQQEPPEEPAPPASPRNNGERPAAPTRLPNSADRPRGPPPPSKSQQTNNPPRPSLIASKQGPPVIEKIRSVSPTPHPILPQLPQHQPHQQQQPQQQPQASAEGGKACHCGCATFVPQSFRKNMCVLCSHVH